MPSQDNLLQLNQLADLAVNSPLLQGIDGENPARRSAETVESLVKNKLVPEMSSIRPLIVLIAGGTNCGKSTLFNWLTGAEISGVTPLARGTKSPVMCGQPELLKTLSQAGLIPGIQSRFISGSTDATQPAVSPEILLAPAPGSFPPQGVLLIDSPDLDSNYAANREWSRRLLTVCDAVIFVVTPEKYNDADVVDFLETIHGMERACTVVFNKTNGMDAVSDFRIKILPDPSWLVIPIPYTPQSLIPRHPVESIHHQVTRWRDDWKTIKRRAIHGTLKSVIYHGEQLAVRLRQEKDWLEDSRRYIETIAEDAVIRYRTKIEKDQFRELDEVFRRLLDNYSNVVDHFYRWAGRSISKSVSWMFREQPGRTDTMQLAVQESPRIQDAFETASGRLARLPDSVPPPLQQMARAWIAELPGHPQDDQITRCIQNLETAVKDWIQEEVRHLDSKLKEHPRRIYIVRGIKGMLQVGGGVAAALSGGINVVDIAVGPLVERAISYLIKSGMEIQYYRSRRKILADIKCGCIRGFLETELVAPILEGIPDYSREYANQITALLETLPRPREIIP